MFEKKNVENTPKIIFIELCLVEKERTIFDAHSAILQDANFFHAEFIIFPFFQRRKLLEFGVLYGRLNYLFFQFISLSSFRISTKLY